MKSVELGLSASVGVVVSILSLCARGVGFDLQPCHHGSMWDMLITTSAGSGFQTEEEKNGYWVSPDKTAASSMN